MEYFEGLQSLPYPHFVIGAGLLLFLLGVGLGVFISRPRPLPRKQSMSPKAKKAQKKAPETPKVKDPPSPTKSILHRIASSLLRSSGSDEFDDAMIEFKDSTNTARSELYSLLGLSTSNRANTSVSWQHVFSNSIAQFWLGSSTRNGIKLRGEAVADSTPCSIVNWLMEQDMVTGLEGLGGKNEIISRTSSDNMIMIIRKVYCKAGSGSLMSSKRDFKIITTIKLKKNGTYVIATRSGPWDYEHAETSGSSNSSGNSTGPVCPNKMDLTKGYIRGIVHASGYVLTPIITDGMPGCEISFGCHVDMKGTRSGRGNTANVNLILSSVLRSIKSIQNGDAEAFAHLEGQSLGYMERIGSWGKVFSRSTSGQIISAPATPLEIEVDGPSDSAGEGPISVHPSPHLFNASMPSTAEKYKLLSVARDAANRMRTQYQDAQGPDNRGVAPRTSFSGPFEAIRETFYDQDGIVIKEVNKDYVSTFGVISATFTVQSPPDAVQKLLLLRPDSVDGFQEGRSILNYLDDNTYVQWMAYGALFPLVSKDFLLVTTHESLDKKKNHGFVIASTSIDDMCVLDRDRRSVSLITGSSGSDNSQSVSYKRSYLRLAGYVGVPNADGTTELTFIVDLPADQAGKSVWMFRYLAQYCLTELAGRIRHALNPFHVGADQSSALRRRASDAEHETEEGATTNSSTSTTAAGALIGGGLNRTADLGRMLASIQEREETVSRRSHHVDRVPVPHGRRDRTTSVDYFSTDEPVAGGGGRTRLESAGFNTWKDARSRANSYIYPADEEPQEPQELNRETLIIDDYRIPTYSPSGSPRGSGKFVSGGIASVQREKSGGGTFAMLKRSLGKKKKEHHVPAGRKSLQLQSPDGDDSSDSRLPTPTSSPRAPGKQFLESSPRSSGKYIDVPPSPHSILPTLPTRLSTKATLDSLRKPSGDEVDIDSVQKELGRISPARRGSKTHARRQSSTNISLVDPSNGLSLDIDEDDGCITPAATPNDSKKCPPSPLAQRSRSSTETARLSMHVDLASLPQTEAWRTYHKYFDTEKAAKELGIDWKLKLNKPNIHIYSSMVENNSWCAIKAVTVMNTTPMTLVRVLLNYDRMGEYDDMFKKSEMVQQVDSNTVIRRLCFKEVWPTAPRDFVVCASWQLNDDGSVLIVSRSVADTYCAQEKGYARGFLQVSGYLLEPYNAKKPVELQLGCAKNGVLSPGECKVTLLNHTELGGTLPSSVINVLSTNAPLKILSTLASIMATEKLEPVEIRESPPAAVALSDDRKKLPPPSTPPPSPAAPTPIHRSQSATETARLSVNHAASHSLSDLASSPQAENSFDLPRAAWRVYHKYFDTEKAAKELGIDWKLKLNKPNIHIYSSMVENNSWCAIKAVTVMNTRPMDLVKVLLDYDRMAEYDDMFKKSEMVQQVDSNTVIRRLCFKEVWPTAPRDFVVCASWQLNDDGSILIVSRSVDDSHCPQEKGYVRGFLQVSGYLLEPYNADKPVELLLGCAKNGVLSPGECKVTLLNHTELGGTLPSSVINVLSTNAPLKVLTALSNIVTTKK